VIWFFARATSLAGDLLSGVFLAAPWAGNVIDGDTVDTVNHFSGQFVKAVSHLCFLRKVPHEAVVEKDGNKHVFVVDDGRAKKVEVTTGIGNELFVEITSGVQKDQVVVINPSEKLQDGSRVKVRDEAKDKGNKGKSDD